MRKEFVSELIGTFSMVFIGCLAIEKGHSAPIISLAFGIAVCIVILISRKYSGASMNPARTLGPNIASSSFNSIPIYFAATILGSSIAAIFAQKSTIIPKNRGA